MKKRTVTLIAVVILAVIVLSGCFFTVREDEYACTVRFSKIIATTSDAGLHFKLPFVDSVKYFTKATQLYDIPPSEVLTSDKQNMTVDCYILWSIGDPKLFYQRLGTTSNAEQRLDALTYNELKTVMGTLAQADIVNMEDGAKRNDIYNSIATDVDALAQTYGIRVEDVKIKQFDLPESNLNAVYNRMISERNQIAEKYTADGNYEASIIRNNVDKQVNIIVSNAKAEAAKLEAEGEGEYMRMLASAYQTQDQKEFYEFTRALDALKASLNGSEKTVILDRDSKLAQILMGNYIAKPGAFRAGLILILIPHLLFRNRLVNDQAVAFQIFLMHIHGSNLVVIVGGVVVNPLAYIAAAGVEGDLIFLFLQTAQSPLLVYAAENVEELADGVQFIVRGQRMELCKSHADKS